GHHDRTPVLAVLLVQGAHVALVGVQGVRLEELHVGRAAHQGEDHQHHHHGQPAQRGVHSPLTTWVGSSPLPKSSSSPWSWSSLDGGVPTWVWAVSPVGDSPRRWSARWYSSSVPSSPPIISRAVSVETSPSASVAGRREESEMRTSRPMMIQFATSEEPPAAMNGMVSPVSGINRVTPPTTTKHWNTRVKASPEASSLPNPSRTPIAIRMPRWASTR